MNVKGALALASQRLKSMNKKDYAMIVTAHLDAWLAALGKRHVEGAMAQMADNVTFRSPIIPVPFEGKEQVSKVLTQLLDTIEAFDLQLLLRNEADFVAIFTIRFGDHTIDGMDRLHLNDAGLIDAITMAWRPLAAVVAVQQSIAPKLGGKPMKLVPVE